MNMAKIHNIINDWELMSCNSEYQKNTMAEPIGLDEAIEVLGEY